jgi:hypothetical protein
MIMCSYFVAQSTTNGLQCAVYTQRSDSFLFAIMVFVRQDILQTPKHRVQDAFLVSIPKNSMKRSSSVSYDLYATFFPSVPRSCVVPLESLPSQQQCKPICTTTSFQTAARRKDVY